MTDQARMIMGLMNVGSDINDLLLVGVCNSEAEAEFIIEQLNQAGLLK